MSASIHTHYSQATYRCGAQKKNINLFLKLRPTGRIRGSNPRVQANGLAGQGDPPRMKPVSHGSIRRWRVGSSRVRSKGFEISRVGSGQEFFKPHGSGRVRSGQQVFNLAGSGRVSGPDPTRSVSFDLTRQKPC